MVELRVMVRCYEQICIGGTDDEHEIQEKKNEHVKKL